MINPSHALVFAMLSTASGWGFPSLDSLLSPNESTHVTGGVDGPRDRRQLGSGSRCDSDWSVLSTPRLSSLTCRCLLPRSVDSYTRCDEACDESCDELCDGFFGTMCDDKCDSSCDSDCLRYTCDCDKKICLCLPAATERVEQAPEDQPQEN